MKKIIPLFALAALFSAALGSCTVVEPVDRPDEKGGNILLTASLEDAGGTRTEVSGTKVLWSPEDVISVFYKFNFDTVEPFYNTATEPSETTDFTGYLSGLTGTALDGKNWLAAIYPYNETYNFFSQDLFGPGQPGVELRVPPFQKAVAGSFDPASFPSVAITKDTHLKFYNVAGGLALRFSEGCQNFGSVYIKSNAGESLSGSGWIPLDNPREPAFSGLYHAIFNNYAVLEPPAGGFQPGVEYLLSAIPADLRYGFTIRFTRQSDSKVAVRKFTKPQVIRRSVFARISGFDSDLQWVEERSDDRTELITGQWKDAQGNIYDFNKTLRGCIVRCTVDDPSFMFATSQEFTSATQVSVFGDIEVKKGNTTYVTFIELSGNRGKLYVNGDGLGPADVREVTAVNPPIALTPKDIALLIDDVRYRVQSNNENDFAKFRKIADDNGGGLPVIYIDAYGTASDFAGTDVAGKVAIVNRGEITFEEKALNAQKAGAIGILFVNNAEGVLYPALGSAAIPGAILPMEIKSHLPGKTWLQCTLPASVAGTYIF
ncbi:MAG: hypothetical protein J5699_07405 [Bacteroidales bacterium]|nr:hypothetical protein [Bacteroidales bacterium]